MGSDVVILEKSFRWPLRVAICGVGNVSIGVLLSPRCLGRWVLHFYAATLVTAVGASGSLPRKKQGLRKQETPCPALRSPRGRSPGMVNIDQNRAEARFMPGPAPVPASGSSRRPADRSCRGWLRVA